LSRIVSIHSFRGGTGKSNILSNIAYRTAEKGLRIGVVDNDVQSPGMSVIFGLDRKEIHHCLNDFLSGDCSISEAAYDVSKSLGLTEKSLYLIPSSLKANDIAEILKRGIDFARLSKGFTELTEALRLDRLLIDTHPGIENETLLCIALCDLLLIVLRPDEQDYLGTAIAVEVAKRLGVAEMGLVVNRVPAQVDADALRKRVAAAYDVPLLGILPFSMSLMLNASKNVFVRGNPKDPFSEGIFTLAELI